MNYYGRILRVDLLTAAQAGQIIKTSLSRMYEEGRFLGGFKFSENNFTYVDASEGAVDSFHGREFIVRGQETAYELIYHGGLIKDWDKGYSSKEYGVITTHCVVSVSKLAV